MMTTDDILELLPTFEQWTRRHAAEAVAAQLAEGRSLGDVVHASLDERDRLKAALERRERLAVADLYAAVHGAPPGRREARAIARGRLGAEALGERAARDIGRRENEALVAFLAVSAHERLHGLSTVVDRAAERLAGEASWRLARAGLDALAARVRVGRWPGAETLARVRALVLTGQAPVWTQTSALELLAATLGQAAVPILTERLRPSARPDDIFVRPAAARVLARLAPPTARQALPAALREEPSEHVRMELLRVLASLGAGHPLRERLDPAIEGSPRVRAVAAIGLAAVAPAELVSVLSGDPDELPRRIALEEAEPLALTYGALGAAIDGLATGRIAATPTLARLAAEACERLYHQRDREGRASLDAVLSAAQGLPEGGRARVDAAMPAAALGRALAVAATDDFGFEAWPGSRGFVVARGDRMGRRLWRALHELRHPAPEKRQGALHTVGRARRGPLRAPPGRLAEVTATRVPGERVQVPEIDDWGRHLPTVDDLLDRPRGGEALIFSAFGVTRLGFPRGLARVRARARLVLRYGAYAELRTRALAAREPLERSRYAAALADLGYTIDFVPHRRGAPEEILQVLRGTGTPAAPAALGLVIPSLGELVRGAVDPSRSGAGHLAALTAAALGFFVIQQNEARRRIERARASIPLTLGGWGTRGKSGTERLKAALFQGLGCEVLAKTTGCEAMVIHALPGVHAQEIFIYRPYDKATIWEQQPLLELAARLGVDVFLWECMALRPAYVSILEQHWMRDDICTLTNTYPDHENIQGPAGIDIPRSMVDFIPRDSHLVTAEDSMLPILRDAATARSTTLSTARFRDHALLPADLVARFPYEEHPRNIALVLDLARLLGVAPEVALKEMADWVVPDLGVLATYPEARWRDRWLEFSNGMSANERTGFLSNWQRLGFDRPAAAGEWVVTVVNNRADRVSRSQVFADVVVNDAAAHAHFLIGTNLAGLRGYIEGSLAADTARLQLFHREEEPLGPARREALAIERAARELGRLRLPAIGAEPLAEMARAMALGLGVAVPLGAEAFEPALTAAVASAGDLAQLEKELEAAMAQRLAAYGAALGARGPEALRFLAREAARHALVLRWGRTVRRACAAREETACARAFRAAYAQLFRASLVTLTDATLSGDQVIDAIARACPPGFRVRIMGTQNIKGTGLDFAYRFIAYDHTVKLIEALAGATGEATLPLATELARTQDAGVLDGPPALAAIHAAAAREGDRVAAALLAEAAAITQRQRQREEALGRRSESKAGPVLGALERLLDVYDGVFRRRRADAIVDELARGHVSHEEAARDLRELMKRQKGGWLA